ncbi:TMEM175 family protein [Actinomyces sp.]|uniref:TMEM175 family protein n=1 Tax=Actinomyces sp. TaxID=29317 RepID=UPI0026DDC134|nr:TMEM175 family protein [Actinomyces sp.]MDO4901636.1 TMEM175 family protein [Actinomyces sp.]
MTKKSPVTTGKERLAAFMDAVLAIIITILILELPQPEVVSPAGLWALHEDLLAYTVSFAWLGLLWARLHKDWNPAEVITRRTVGLSLLLLFFASFFPYTTTLVAQNPGNSTAQVAYGLVFLLTSISRVAVRQSLQDADPENEKLAPPSRDSRTLTPAEWGLQVLGLVLAAVWVPRAMTVALLGGLIVGLLAYLQRQRGEVGE